MGRWRTDRSRRTLRTRLVVFLFLRSSAHGSTVIRNGSVRPLMAGSSSRDGSARASTARRRRAVRSRDVLPCLVTGSHGGTSACVVRLAAGEGALPPPLGVHLGMARQGLPAPTVAKQAGHSVQVLIRVYARCVDRQEEHEIGLLKSAGQPHGLSQDHNADRT